LQHYSQILQSILHKYALCTRPLVTSGSVNSGSEA